MSLSSQVPGFYACSTHGVFLAFFSFIFRSIVLLLSAIAPYAGIFFHFRLQSMRTESALTPLRIKFSACSRR